MQRFLFKAKIVIVSNLNYWFLKRKNKSNISQTVPYRKLMTNYSRLLNNKEVRGINPPGSLHITLQSVPQSMVQHLQIAFIEKSPHISGPSQYKPWCSMVKCTQV